MNKLKDLSIADAFICSSIPNQQDGQTYAVALSSHDLVKKLTQAVSTLRSIRLPDVGNPSIFALHSWGFPPSFVWAFRFACLRRQMVIPALIFLPQRCTELRFFDLAICMAREGQKVRKGQVSMVLPWRDCYVPLHPETFTCCFFVVLPDWKQVNKFSKS